MKFVWKDGAWRDGDGKEMEVIDRIACPTVQSDTPAYFSVATGKWVDGRRARRDDLARSGCRPQETGEGPRWVTNKKLAQTDWARRNKLEFNDDPKAKRPKHWDADWKSTRQEI